jgi:hypothetical protein
LKTTFFPPGAIPDRQTCLFPATRQQVHIRTREIASISGRGPLEVSQNDYEQARREVTGESDGERQEAVLDLISAPLRPAADHGRAKRNEAEFSGPGFNQQSLDSFS